MSTAIPTDSNSSTRFRRLWARATPLLLCRLAMWGFVCLLITRTNADADLWGHLRFGLDMIESQTLPAYDSYSFTSDRPWVNHEWLAELLTAAAWRVGGSPGLVVLKLSVIGFIAWMLFAIARQERVGPLARDVFVAVTLFATYTRTLFVRPQLFSIAVFCVVLYLLRLDRRGHRGVLWGVPICFALWVNLHGGWIVGLGALGIWMAADVWQSRNAARARHLLIVGVLTLLATLVNPYGTGLWHFVAETVRFERAEIMDWKPFLQLPVTAVLFNVLLPAVAVLALWQQRFVNNVPLREVAVVALLMGATLKLGRVDAFLQASIAVLLAPQLLAFLNGVHGRIPRLVERPSPAVAALAAALVALIGVGSLENVRAVRVHGHWVPDPAAAMFLRDERPGARVLTWFDWGQYALWQLSPAGIRISMDGRRETIYSQRVLDDHNRFYRGEAEMADYPDRIGADHIWLPSDFAIIGALRERGWVTVLDTGRSLVLARDGAPVDSAMLSGSESEPALFPWP